MKAYEAKIKELEAHLAEPNAYLHHFTADSAKKTKTGTMAHKQSVSSLLILTCD